MKAITRFTVDIPRPEMEQIKLAANVLDITAAEFVRIAAKHFADQFEVVMPDDHPFADAPKKKPRGRKAKSEAAEPTSYQMGGDTDNDWNQPPPKPRRGRPPKKREPEPEPEPESFDEDYNVENGYSDDDDFDDGDPEEIDFN